MATRTQVRDTIMQMLYSCDLGNVPDKTMVDEELKYNKINNEKSIFAKDLFYGSIDNLEEIDIQIDTYLREWDFNRIGHIERALFRLGTYELLYTNTSANIIINEIISISKQYCTQKSTNFINGVLNAIYEGKEK
jgi:N utilization substance protein B